MRLLDRALNSITMYRLVLYVLIGLVGLAAILGFTGHLPYSGLTILESAAGFMVVCVATNYIFARVFGVTANAESAYITALILALIITPSLNWTLLVWASVLAISSKFILAIHHKHVFNPAAIAVVLTTFGLHQSASWWVGTTVMAPAVLAGGLLVVRKLRRFDMVLAFFATALVSVALTSPSSIFSTVIKSLEHSPVLFLATIMLTEPLTTPPTRARRLVYGALVGALVTPQLHIGSVYSTPELALVAGNLFSFIVSPKFRRTLRLKSRTRIAHNTYEFVFAGGHPQKFKPGQYMEWTLDVPKADTRGNRRYFTVASSPTEPDLRLGIKFYDPPSSFKQALTKLRPGGKITASSLAGDFTLPSDPSKKLVFIAGGIGITPFRSMLKYLLDSSQKRQITLFYVAHTPGDFAFKNLLEKAREQLGLRVIYVATSQKNASIYTREKPVRLDEEVIRQELSAPEDHIFYISGPNSMVASTKKILTGMGIRRRNITTDYFPGF